MLKHSISLTKSIKSVKAAGIVWTGDWRQVGRGSLGIYCLLIDRAEREVGWSGGLGGILNSELIPQTLGVMGPPAGILPGLAILPPTQGNHLILRQPRRNDE